MNRPLRRLLGPVTTTLVGIGVAVGSGIFAAPHETSGLLDSPWIILALWLGAGMMTLAQGLVTAELATRFPRAGGEYQFLKEAYGELAAFVFGWGFTVFIVAGGTGSIAAFLGTSAAALFRLEGPAAAPACGCAAVAAVTLANALGLRTGAFVGNVLTVLKLAVLLGVAAAALLSAPSWLPASAAIGASESAGPASPISASLILTALLSVCWAYSGATDAVKLAEEVHNPRRDLPRALAGACLLLTGTYFAFNYALFCAMTPAEMARRPDVVAQVLSTYRGLPVDRLVLSAIVLICLGAVSASALSNVRITYALARDGLAPRFLAGMSERQAPIASLFAVGALACCFVAFRRFRDLLSIYFTAAAVLFGLSYLSLIVFRLRDRAAGRPFPADAFRAPAGVLLAAGCAAFQSLLVANNLVTDLRRGSRDTLYTLAVLIGLALLYGIWRAVRPAPPSSIDPSSAR